MTHPKEYRYTKEHEWIRADGNTGTVGITHYAQEKLGDVVFVDLPEKGKKLAAMEALGSIESVKAVSDIYCPVSGEVAEVNSALQENPALINEDPHGKGWLIKVKFANPKELDNLMEAEKYEEFLQSEAAEQ